MGCTGGRSSISKFGYFKDETSDYYYFITKEGIHFQDQFLNDFKSSNWTNNFNELLFLDLNSTFTWNKTH